MILKQRTLTELAADILSAKITDYNGVNITTLDNTNYGPNDELTFTIMPL